MHADTPPAPPGPRDGRVRRRRRRALGRVAAVAAAGAVLMAGCDSAPAPRGPHPSGTGSGRPSATPPTAATAPPATGTSSGTASTAPRPSTTTGTPGPTSAAASCARSTYNRLSPAERIGQLLMVGMPATGVDQAGRQAIADAHVGNVFLSGRSRAGVTGVTTVTRTVSRLTTAAAGGVAPWISADQEGGEVQTLRGPGFTSIVTAVGQGNQSPAALTRQARQWGSQLRAAGVDMNLAPVLDTVPASLGGTNPPIGAFDREYGHTPAAVTTHGVAVLRGFRAAGIVTAVKHFPGLGRVRANTDTSTDAVDPTTTRHGPTLAPFRAAIAAGTPAVLVSLARYPKIDPRHLAVFSPIVLHSMLRADLGFGGVVVSDDLGAAVAVSHLSPGTRAVRFVAAGGDIVLTVKSSDAAPMSAAIARRARTDAAFASTVATAVRTVLTTKVRTGTLHCG